MILSSMISSAGYKFRTSTLSLAISRRRLFQTQVQTSETDRPRRSYLYVPSSSEKMLEKSLSIDADTLVYDLEDSVAPQQKNAARHSLATFLSKSQKGAPIPPERVAVRLNAIDTQFFEEDIRMIAGISNVRTLVLPKIHTARDLDVVASALSEVERRTPLNLIASIESARALWQVGEIASWISRRDPGRTGALTALLFAAEDYCADSRVIRTPSRQELLYVRSRISAAAKAFGLHAIDMVCVNYKDQAYLEDECEDGRRLGYDGKQAIHPAQVQTINVTFVPTEQGKTRIEIQRATTIIRRMAESHADAAGAFGLDVVDQKGVSTGGAEMIDAPMVKQAENTLRLARSAGLPIPEVVREEILPSRKV